MFRQASDPVSRGTASTAHVVSFVCIYMYLSLLYIMEPCYYDPGTNILFFLLWEIICNRTRGDRNIGGDRTIEVTINQSSIWCIYRVHRLLGPPKLPCGRHETTFLCCCIYVSKFDQLNSLGFLALHALVPKGVKGGIVLQVYASPVSCCALCVCACVRACSVSPSLSSHVHTTAL